MNKALTNAQLPCVFDYLSTADLVRIGRCNDGGYLVSKSDVHESELLISLGISNDWSFEEGFLELNKKLKVICYDASVNENLFLKRLIKSVFKFYRFRKLTRALSDFTEYRNFFRGG